jgi:hypothetical protein
MGIDSTGLVISDVGGTPDRALLSALLLGSAQGRVAA